MPPSFTQKLLNRRKVGLPSPSRPRPPSSGQEKASPLPPNIRRSIPKRAPSEFGSYAEIQRVCNLPVVADLTPSEVDTLSRQLLAADFYASGERLFHTQANAIHRYMASGGGFLPIGVGWGKTLISLMICNIAYNRDDDPVSKIILLVPPNVVKQLVKEDLPFWRRNAKIQFPHHVLAGQSQKQRMIMAKRGLKGVYIMAYSQLSGSDTEELLDSIGAGLFVCDEAQNLLDTKSARSNRIYKHWAQNAPEVVAMSGTITGKSLMEYFRLSKFCLGKSNFLPNTHPLAAEWATFLDAEATKDGLDMQVSAKRMGPIAPLLTWANNHLGMDLETTPSGFRKAYQARMVSSPGCYSSGDSKIDCDLTIEQIQLDPIEFDDYEGRDKVVELARQVEVDGLTPNGDEIDHAFHAYKWLAEICGAGFYNELIWPEPERLQNTRGISLAEAEELLERAKLHHGAHNEYAAELRKYFSRRARKGFDTPMLVGREFSLHGTTNLPRETQLYSLWETQKSLDFDLRPEREPRAVFLCDWKIVEALTWAADLPLGDGGIIWYQNIAVGNWMYSYLKDAGLNCLHCPSGPRHDVAIKDPRNANKIIVASIQGHGTGKNLQHFRHQFYLQWPRPAKEAEQVLGRLHRNGQKQKRITAHVVMCDEWDYLNFAATLNSALYIHQTMGNRQKLIYASYSPPPKIFPANVLKERGVESVSYLSEENEQIMREKFGDYEQ